MNKKILGIVIGVVALVLIASIGIMKSKGISPVKGIQGIIKPSVELESPAKFLPGNTIMFYSLSDLKGIWGDISKSKFWADFLNLKFLSDFNIRDSLKKIVGSLEEKIRFEVNESNIMDLLGKRVIVGVALDSATKDVKVYLQSYVGKKIEFLEKTLNGATGIEAKKTEYNGETILLFSPAAGADANAGSPEIRYVLVNNVLTVVFGKGENDIKQIIDLIKGKSESLYNDKNYAEMLKYSSGDSDCISQYFADFTKIYGILPELLKPLIEAQPEQFAGLNMGELTKNIEQLKMIGGKAYRTREGVRMGSYIVPNFEKMTAEDKKTWNIRPSKLESLSFAPADAIFCTATGLLDAAKLWQTFSEATASSAPAGNGTPEAASAANPFAAILSGIRDFEKKLNIDLKKDVVDQIGNEMSLIFSGINLESQIPIPRIGLIIKSPNPSGLKDKLKTIMEKMFSAENAPVQIKLESKTIEGIDFMVLKTQFGEGLSPVAGVSDSWLVFASNAAVAEKIVKAKKGSETLIDSPSFKIMAGKNDSSSQISYGNLKAGLSLLTEIINWVLQRKDLIPQAEQYKDMAATIATYAVPFIECLKVFDTIGFSSSKEGDISVQEISLNIYDLK